MSIISNLHFIHQEWMMLVIVVGILLFILYGWKEWKGQWDRRFWINCIIAAIGIVSLMLLFLRPTWPLEIKKDGILLTEGYAEEQWDSITRSDKGLKTINYKPGDDLKEQLDSLSGITILGQGVKPFDFWQLVDKTVDFMPAKISKGITRLKYEENNFLGKDLIVKGEYIEPVQGNKLMLQNAGGGDLDSVLLEAGNSFLFELKTNLKSTGKYLYRLAEKDSLGNILSSEPIPVSVDAPVISKILIINQFPSFETKYLKNFLAEEGHEVTVRSQITRQKFKFEYFNTDANPIYRLSENVLENYDLLILDEQTYTGFSGGENTILMNSIKKGMGAFVQPSEDLFLGRNKLPEIKFVTDGLTKIELPMVQLRVEKYPYKFVENGIKSVAIEGYGYYVIHGKGTYGTSILKNTYQLILNGQDEIYKEVWTSLIEKLIKGKESTGEIKTSGKLIYQDRPFEFSVTTQEKNPIIMHSEGFQVPVIKDVSISNKWHGISYPRNTGWNKVYSDSDSTLFMNYFVLDSSQWKTLDAVRTKLENQRFFNENRNESATIRIPQEIERFWFFLIAVLCMGYLWLIPKLKI